MPMPPPAVPEQAPHSVNCEEGGKHNPTTWEAKLRGTMMKYKVCTKCYKSLK